MTVAQPFIHLNVKSEYSLLNSILKTKDLLKFCSEHEMPAIAVTDINVMYNAWHYQTQAKNMNPKVHSIIGCTFNISYGSVYGNIELLAKTREGYRSLVALSTLANTNFSAEKEFACLKLSDLHKYKKDLICLTGGTCGLPFTLYRNTGNWQESINVLKELTDIYGCENVYLEFQNHKLQEEIDLLNSQDLYNIMTRLGIKPVATNDVYYLKKEYSYHRSLALKMIPESKKYPYYDNSVAITSAMVSSNDEWYLKSAEEMTELFAPWFGKYPDILSNTVQITDECKATIPKEEALPEFPIPEGYTEESYFRKLCEEGFHERFDGRTDIDLDVYRKRFEYEFDVIKKMGFMDYHTITADFIQWAKDSEVYKHPRKYFPEDHYPDLNALPEKVWKKNYEILVGPGRGSAAGSLLCYCLKITNLDPIKDGLLFERFLNVERVSMPDIDVDFPNKYRYDVVEYVQAKYGYEKVCQIATFQTLGVKSIIKSLGKSLGMSYEETDRMTKEVPDTECVEELNKDGVLEEVEKKVELLSQLEKYEFFKHEIASNETVAKLFEAGKVLEGLPSTTGKHAAGVIIGRKSLMNYMPLMEVEGVMVSQFEKRAAEDIGMLKMDFLGLQTLDILMETRKLIRKTEGISINFNDIPVDDEKVYKEIFQNGNTGKVFQFESPGMKKLLIRMKPTCLADLCAANAAYRPGPMQFIDDFIDGRNHPENVKYPTKEYETIAEETKGILFYQEQVMQIVQAMAGFTLGEADILRRGIGKKIKHYIDEGRENFIAGCKKLGTADEKMAREIYATIEKFANYGFNKSHSDAYALVAYWCAWLKCHYPEHFMAANCTIASTDSLKLLSCIHEVLEMKLPILAPDLRKSYTTFSLEPCENGMYRYALRMSLPAITSIREDSAKAVLNVPDKSTFQSVIKNISMENINKRQLTALIYAGAFDYTGNTRLGMVNNLEPSLMAKKKYSEWEKENPDTCSILVSDIEFPVGNETLSKIQRLKEEKNCLQVCLSDHPVSAVRKQTGIVFDTSKINDDMVGENVSILGCVLNLRPFTTRQNNVMATFTLDDEYGSVPAIVFPKCYRVLKDVFTKLEDTTPVKIIGKLVVDKKKEEAGEVGYQIYVNDIDFVTLKKQSLFVQYNTYEEKENILNESRKYPGNSLFYVMNFKGEKVETLEKVPWEIDLESCSYELKKQGVRVAVHKELTL